MNSTQGRCLALALAAATVASCRSGGSAGEARAADPPPSAEPTSVAAAPILPPSASGSAAEPDASGSDESAASEGVAATATVPMIRAGQPNRTGGDRASMDAVTAARDERLVSVTGELEAAMQAFYELFAKTTTEAEVQQLMETATPPDPAPYLATVRAIIEEDTSDSVACRALIWTLEQPGVDTESRSWCIARLAQHHFERVEMADAIQSLAYAPGADARDLLTRLTSDSPHHDVRGLALMGQANALSQSLDMADLVRDLVDPEQRQQAIDYMSEAEFNRLLNLDRERVETQLAAIYERVVRDYSDVSDERGSIADAATGSLRELRDLKVGKYAPEISGEDIDGVAFNLSDYRGQVVLLDFWGHW